jgi:hypothetical protein
MTTRRFPEQQSIFELCKYSATLHCKTREDGAGFVGRNNFFFVLLCQMVTNNHVANRSACSGIPIDLSRRTAICAPGAGKKVRRIRRTKNVFLTSPRRRKCSACKRPPISEMGLYARAVSSSSGRPGAVLPLPSILANLKIKRNPSHLFTALSIRQVGRTDRNCYCRATGRQDYFCLNAGQPDRRKINRRFG